MFSFLEEYYSLTKSDDVGALLGSMTLLNDGTSSDPAIIEDWKEAVNRTLEEGIDAKLTIKST
ncbi:hypothetical protein [uncultured Pseudoteredinibacter sp.]|uniref:hypothetical protein n=1 Tax=uncultured Pseudoteredinibacter sp. TaxID=1641701 RepID=UPI00262E7A66|nr:hypothetical protein [uncultured Pseudoteredinibacter sp.]